MKNLLRLIRTIMLTRVAIQPQVSPTTLPSWLEDFNGLVGIGISNPGEGELILRRADPHNKNADRVGPDRTASEGPQKLGLSGLPDVR
jgi:hypothetical protein